MLEEEIEGYLKKKVKAAGGRAYKFNSGIRGMPDRIVLFPNAWIFFVELKAPGKKARRLQEKRMKELREMNFKAMVIDSKAKVDELIRLIEVHGG